MTIAGVTPPGAIAVQPGEVVTVDGHTLRNIGPTVLYVQLTQSYGAKLAHMTFTEALEAMRRGARCERPGADHELGFADGFLEQWGGDVHGDGRTLRITLEDVLATDWRVVE